MRFVFQTMEVLENGHELVFLYQLIDGSVNCSFARHIASLAGLPEELLDRASQVQPSRLRQPVFF